MNKKSMILIALAMCAVVGWAQGAGPQGGKAGKPGQGGPGGPGGQGGFRMDPAKMGEMRKKMEAAEDAALKKVNATPQQIKDLVKLRKDVNAKRDAIMKEALKGGGQPDFQALRPKMEEIRDFQKKGLEKILKPEQLKEFQKLMKEAREKLRPGGGGRGVGAPGGGGRANGSRG